MGIIWIYLVIISTLILNTVSSNIINEISETACSANSEDIDGECKTFDLYLKNGKVSESKVKQDINTESKIIENEQDNFNQKEKHTMWDQVFDYNSIQGKVIKYSFICIFIFSVARVYMNTQIYSDAPEKETKDVKHYKEGALLGNKIIFPGDLVRPLDRLELLYGVGVMRRSYGTHQAIWLRSKSQIDEQIMHDALTELTRRLPLLQLCIKLRRFRLWFKRIESMKIDFSVIESSDTLTEYRNETNFAPDPFKGPLWRVKLVKCPLMANQPNERNFSSVLIFSVAHCITDGFTNNLLCKETVRLYNLLMSKQPIPIAPMLLPLPLGDAYPSYNIFTSTIQVAMIIIGTLFNTFNVRCISPINIVESPMKIAINLDELTEGETSKLLNMCKKINITVNSFVSTAAALAYAQTVHEFSGGVLHQMNVNIMHNVNLRRYFKKDSDELAGSYASIAITESIIDLKNNSNLWKEALELQTSLKLSIDNNEPHFFSSVFPYIWWLLPVMEWKRYISSYETALSHIIITNMGEISVKLPPVKDNESAEIYDVLRSTSGLHLFIPMILTVHTFRKNLKFSLDIGTISITEAAAKYFFSSLMKIVRSTCEQEMLSN